jgi:hypothetical protein
VITYFIQHAADKRGPVKIGVAKTLQHRLKAIRDFPGGMRLLGYIDGNVEHWTHLQFMQSSLKGGGREWFQPSVELINHILANAVIENDSRQDLCAWKRSLTRRRVARSVSEADALNKVHDPEEVLCTDYWDLYTLHIMPDEGPDPPTMIVELLDCEFYCNGFCCFGDDGHDDEWDGPDTDCPGCSSWWAVDTLLAYDEFLLGLGIHEDRRELLAFLKPINSRRRQHFLEETLVDVFAALDVGGVEIKVVAERGRGVECFGLRELFCHAFQKEMLSDAMVDWFTAKTRLSYGMCEQPLARST